MCKTLNKIIEKHLGFKINSIRATSKNKFRVRHSEIEFEEYSIYEMSLIINCNTEDFSESRALCKIEAFNLLSSLE